MNTDNPQHAIKIFRVLLALNQKQFGKIVLGLGEHCQNKVSNLENGLKPTDAQIEAMNAYANKYSMDWRYPTQDE